MSRVVIADATGASVVSASSLEALRSQLATGTWEVELGFGKGRYLLDRAAREPEVRFLGIEVAARYYRMVRERALRRRLDNLVLLCGEAAYILSSMLPSSFADRLHVYFPDPWPKERHARRRLMDAEDIDLVLGLLKPGADLLFASDHLEHGAQVEQLLVSHPSLQVRRLDAWSEGPRTNYEAKFVARGVPIRRLVATLSGAELRHPEAPPLDAASALDPGAREFT